MAKPVQLKAQKPPAVFGITVTGVYAMLPIYFEGSMTPKSMVPGDFRDRLTVKTGTELGQLHKIKPPTVTHPEVLARPTSTMFAVVPGFP